MCCAWDTPLKKVYFGLPPGATSDHILCWSVKMDRIAILLSFSQPTLQIVILTARTGHPPSVVLMLLNQRLRRWSNIKPTLSKCISRRQLLYVTSQGWRLPLCLAIRVIRCFTFSELLLSVHYSIVYLIGMADDDVPSPPFKKQHSSMVRVQKNPFFVRFSTEWVK